MRILCGLGIFSYILTPAVLPAEQQKQPPATRPNILLLVADDLATRLGCYGDTAAMTLGRWFREHGYQTFSVGKIDHTDPRAWDIRHNVAEAADTGSIIRSLALRPLFRLLPRHRLFPPSLFAVHPTAAASMQDGQADHLVTPVTHDDVIGAKLAVGRLNSRLEVYVHHVGRLVIRALHRTLWSLQHRGDHVEKIA
jgi:hypothetical protein